MKLVEFLASSVALVVGFVGAAYADEKLPIVIDVRVSPYTGRLVWFVVLVVCVALFYGVIGWVAARVPRRIELPPDEEDDADSRPTWPSIPAAKPEAFDDISRIRERPYDARKVEGMIVQALQPHNDTKPSMAAVRPDALEKFLIASDAEMATRKRAG